MRRVVALVLDGLRRDMLTEALTPNLAAHAQDADVLLERLPAAGMDGRALQV